MILYPGCFCIYFLRDSYRFLRDYILGSIAVLKAVVFIVILTVVFFSSIRCVSCRSIGRRIGHIRCCIGTVVVVVAWGLAVFAITELVGSLCLW